MSGSSLTKKMSIRFDIVILCFILWMCFNSAFVIMSGPSQYFSETTSCAQNAPLLKQQPRVSTILNQISAPITLANPLASRPATYRNASQVAAAAKIFKIPLQPASWLDLSKDDVCYPMMKKLFALNECYRSMDGSACKADDDDDDDEGNIIMTTSNKTQPLYNFAYYHGQGLGRVLEHSTIHCLVATALNRPCVIDLQPYDPYYTIRSFYQKNLYDWSPDLAKIEHGVSIADAVSKLPSIKADVWPNELVYRNIAPLTMVPNVTKKNGNKILVPLYDAKNDQSPYQKKLLVSPSWSSAWHGRLDWTRLHNPCPWTDALTLTMNAMYKPTDLAEAQFENHRQKIWKKGQSFGAIQLRTRFIEEGSWGWEKNDGRDRIEKMQELVVDCMEKVPEVKQWWILSDNATVAIELTQKVGDDKMRHGYTEEFIRNNQHSKRAKNGPYLHNQLEPSVMDWMTLSKAEVAIVFKHGSFGQSGARGGNKVFRDESGYKCGGDSMLIFRRRTPNIYRYQQE